MWSEIPGQLTVDVFNYGTAPYPHYVQTGFAQTTSWGGFDHLNAV